LTGAAAITNTLTISASLPFVRQDDIREGEHSHGHGHSVVNSVANRGSVSGVGDITVAAKYRLLGGDKAGAAMIAGIKAPTGSTRKRDTAGDRFETEHQPGSGSWDALVGAAAGTPLGALQIDGSLMYQLSGKGAMRTRLGDRLVTGLALSRRFGGSDDHHTAGADSDPHGHSSWDVLAELTAEWEGRQKVNGVVDRHSGGKAVYLSPAIRLNTASNWSVTGQIGVPVLQRIRSSHPDVSYRLSFGLAHVF
jgi:hypothetical protein